MDWNTALWPFAIVAFIVLMAGPGIRGDRLLVMQNGLISGAEFGPPGRPQAPGAAEP